MALAGNLGIFKIGANAVQEISGWNITETTDTVETTHFASNGKKEFIPTLSSWSGSLEGNWVGGSDTTGQKLLLDAKAANTPIIGVFCRPNGTTLTGTFYITQLDHSTKVGEKIGFALSFQGTGALVAS